MQPRFSHSSKPRRGPRTACLPALLVVLATFCALLPTSARAQSPGDVADEIVYIDPAGVVRVRDGVPAGGVGVTWFSPVSGYTDAVLLDVNGDTDYEIAALRSAGDNYTLDIYDPVVATGPVAPGQNIGGVPWANLALIPLATPVGVLGVGNLDPATPGDEILLSSRVAATGTGASTVYRQSLYYLRNSGAHDGHTWEAVALPISSEDWRAVALGDMNLDGVDEIALVAPDTGTLTLWQMRGSTAAARVYKNESDNRPWLDVAMGPFRGGGDLLGAVRDAPLGLPSLVILRWNNGSLADEYGREFDPSPNFIFFGDINGSGDAEAYMLRDVDPTLTGRSRLFMRQRGDDAAALTDDVLDVDNGYKVGAAGDIDGDGKDEVVLIRNNFIREYLAPDTSVTPTLTSMQTNERTLIIGNLDAIGYLPEVVFAATPAAMTESAPAGTPATVRTLEIAASPPLPAVPFSVAVADRPGWLDVSTSRSTTPAQVTLTFNASALSPGSYTTRLLFSSSSPLVLQQPFAVPITFTVARGLLVRPLGMAFIFLGCPDAGVQTQQLAVETPADTPYSVALLSAGAEATAAAAPDAPWPSSVPWLSATSSTGRAPENVTLTADSALAGGGVAGARAIVMATVDSVQLVRTVPITLLCAETQIHLPVVTR